MNVVTAGTFDLFHHGHARLLNFCRELAGPTGGVAVIVNRDDFIERFKGRRPVVSLKDRMEMIRQFPGVNQVRENHGNEDLRPAINSLRHNFSWRIGPNIIVIGTDWLLKGYLNQTKLSKEWLEKENFSLLYAPYTAGISSTEIRKRMT